MAAELANKPQLIFGAEDWQVDVVELKGNLYYMNFACKRLPACIEAESHHHSRKRSGQVEIAGKAPLKIE